MPKRNPKPFMVIQTKEEFDEIFQKIFQIGREQGHADGRDEGISLSRFRREQIQSGREQGRAEGISLSRFRREQILLDNAKKKAVEDYKASMKEKESEE